MAIEDRIRASLQRRASRVVSVVPDADAWLAVEHRLTRRRNTARVLAASVSLALASSAVSGVWVAFRSRDPNTRPAAEGTSVPRINAAVASTIPVGPSPGDLAADQGAVWVSVPAQDPSAPDLVVEIDQATNQVTSRIPVEGSIGEIAAGEGAVWGIVYKPLDADAGRYQGSLVRIDPGADQVVATIPGVTGPLAVGAGAVWATANDDSDGSLVRIDPVTNKIVATVPLGVRPWHISVGLGAVWVLPLHEQGVVKVDPVTNTVAEFIEVEETGSLYPPALGDNIVWLPVVRLEGSFIIRIDARTTQVLGSPVPVPAASPFAVAEGRVWLLDERGAVYGLNEQTLQVDESVEGFAWPARVSIDPSAELDPTTRTIWIANHEETVTRINLG